jgi:hypothetical protein
MKSFFFFLIEKAVIRIRDNEREKKGLNSNIFVWDKSLNSNKNLKEKYI